MLSAMVVAYLFLGGAGAGACVVLSVLGLLVPRSAMTRSRLAPSGKLIQITQIAPVYRRLLAPGYVIAFGFVAVGALLLIADLGVGSKVHLLFASPHLTLLTFGSYALLLLLVVALLLGLMWGVPAVHVRYPLAVAGQVACLVLGLSVVSYTGLLLSSMPAVPLWSSAWVAVLFIASSLSCGSALVLACVCMTGSLGLFESTIRRVMHVDLIVFALEGVAVVAVLLAAFSNSYGIAGDGARALLDGELSMMFVVGFGVVGIVTPVVIELGLIVLRKQNEAFVLVAAAAVLVGGYLLRHCIVAAGAHPAVWALAS